MNAVDALRAGGKAALARLLALHERRPRDPETLATLDAAWGAQKGHAIGLTGPPGVGKSTLADALIRALRARGRRVALIAVDPSSRRSRGALLGDRTRLSVDPEDDGVFVRSLAARDRLGGLAAGVWPAVVAMRALFDVVLVETVGVGQSETEIADVADTVLFCAQPGSGDALQYMKAGVVEIPDIALVTKSDMGAAATRAAADLAGALSLAAGGDSPPVLLCSAADGSGVDALVAALDARAASGAVAARRVGQVEAWMRADLTAAFGSDGFAMIREEIESFDLVDAPFTRALSLRTRLSRALSVGFTQQ